MLSKEQVLEAVKGGRESACLDGRDYARLVDFFEPEHLITFGFALKEGGVHTAAEFTRENVLEQLKRDIEFGFEKAINQRGISAAMMYHVVKMWMWILEDDLQNHDDDTGYANYGLPLFKAVALKYGFENPIGDKTGTEAEFAG